MGFFRQEYWSGLPCPPLGDLPNPGIEPRFPTLQADSLPSEPPENPKNSRVGSLFLLQGIFPIQESNLGLMHYRQILHHLNHQGNLACCLSTPFALFPFMGDIISNLNGPLGQNCIICAIYPPSACLHNPYMSETSLALASSHPL